jgi:hypothetical protein
MRKEILHKIISLVLFFIIISVSLGGLKAGVSSDTRETYLWFTIDGKPVVANYSVSRTSGSSLGVDMILDSNDFPHLVWSEKINDYSDIYYIKWNGKRWVCADGEEYQPSNNNITNPANISKSKFLSGLPDIVLDENDNPIITWADGINKENPGYTSFHEYEIFLIRWNSESWVAMNGSKYNPAKDRGTNDANISQNLGSSFSPSLQLDSKGFPHLCWVDCTFRNENNPKDQCNFVYLSWDGCDWICSDDSIYDSSNSNFDNSVNVSRYEGMVYGALLKLDENDNPHICWSLYRGEWSKMGKSNGWEIYYLSWDGANWVSSDKTIYNPANMGINNPACVSAGNIRTYSSVALELDNEKNPHIVWKDKSFGRYTIVYVKWDGENWVCSNNSLYDVSDREYTNPAIISKHKKNSYSPKILLNNYSQICVSWFSENIVYFRELDTKKELQLVATSRFVFYLDKQGNPFFAWSGIQSQKCSQVFCVKRDYGKWLLPNGLEFLFETIETIETKITPVADIIYSNNKAQSIAVDSEGNTHLVWAYSFVGSIDIGYIKWDEDNWVCADGSIFELQKYSWKYKNSPANITKSDSNSRYPCLVLDSNNYPHLIWCESADNSDFLHIFYIRWDGRKWVHANGTTYYPNNMTNRAYVTKTNLKSNRILYPLLRLDSNDYPHIVWDESSKDYSTTDIVYIKWNGNKWVCPDGSSFDKENILDSNANVSNNSGYSNHPSFKLDNNDTPHLVWSDKASGGYEIFYVKQENNKWVCADGSEYSLSKQAKTNPVNISKTLDHSWQPSLDLDSKGNPHTTWRDYSFGSIRQIVYLKFSNGQWLCANDSIYDPSNQYPDNPVCVSNTISQSESPIIQIDNFNNPHLVWLDNSFENVEILYCTWNNSNWVCRDGSVYDSSNTDSDNPAIVSITEGNPISFDFVLNNSNKPYISWNLFEEYGSKLYLLKGNQNRK